MESVEPKRRRLRFSLRSSMAIILILGLWMGWQVNKARRQREAVAAVKAYGGWVHYDWELVNGKLAKGTQPRAPKWLRMLVGDEYFQDIAHVSLVYDDFNGRVDIRNYSPADKVLAGLSGQTNLKVLLLKGTQATDLGLKHVGKLTSLERLLIWDAQSVSDVGAAHLESLKNLKYINIHKSTISDSSLASLAKLPRLEVMALQQNHFTDAGLAFLKGSANLKELYVGHGALQVTDAGLPHLKNLRNLEVIDLQGSQVTDAGLESLKGHSKLKELWAGGSQITQEGKASFKAAMPNMKVIR